MISVVSRHIIILIKYCFNNVLCISLCQINYYHTIQYIDIVRINSIIMLKYVNFIYLYYSAIKKYYIRIYMLNLLDEQT